MTKALLISSLNKSLESEAKKYSNKPSYIMAIRQIFSKYLISITNQNIEDCSFQITSSSILFKARVNSTKKIYIEQLYQNQTWNSNITVTLYIDNEEKSSDKISLSNLATFLNKLVNT